METTLQRSPFVFQCGKKVLHLSSRTHIMGVLNVTPDSFLTGRILQQRESCASCAPDGRGRGGFHRCRRGVIETERAGTVKGRVTRTSRRGVAACYPGHQRNRGTVRCRYLDRYVQTSVAEAALHAGASIVNDISGLSISIRPWHLSSRHTRRPSS